MYNHLFVDVNMSIYVAIPVKQASRASMAQEGYPMLCMHYSIGWHTVILMVNTLKGHITFPASK